MDDLAAPATVAAGQAAVVARHVTDADEVAEGVSRAKKASCDTRDTREWATNRTLTVVAKVSLVAAVMEVSLVYTVHDWVQDWVQEVQSVTAWALETVPQVPRWAYVRKVQELEVPKLAPMAAILLEKCDLLDNPKQWDPKEDMYRTNTCRSMPRAFH